MQRFMRQKRHLGHISTHFWHGSRPVVIGPHTKCMTSMTSMTSTARVRARSRAPYIRKLFFLIFIFSKFQSDCWYGLIQENRKMPSEWLGVHGGRSYGPSPRGKSLPGPAVVQKTLNYIFAEISKNGLGSIPLKVPQAARRFDHCNG